TRAHGLVGCRIKAASVAGCESSNGGVQRVVEVDLAPERFQDAGRNVVQGSNLVTRQVQPVSAYIAGVDDPVTRQFPLDEKAPGLDVGILGRLQKCRYPRADVLR